MSQKPPLPTLQNASRNDLPARADGSDSLAAWMEAYFRLEVTTLESSQSVQRRDLALFLSFMRQEVGSDERAQWTPRLSQAFKVALQKHLEEDGSRRWNDRTVNRILAHLKTFARWIHTHELEEIERIRENYRPKAPLAPPMVRPIPLPYIFQPGRYLRPYR